MASISSTVDGILQAGAADDDGDDVPEVALESHATSTGDLIGRVAVPDDESLVMKGGEAAAASDFANYFCSYAYLYHQVTIGEHFGTSPIPARA